MIDTELPFANRRDAGRRLAAALAPLGLADPVILALPRGGVPVAYEIARRLHASLDILIARKIGAPGHEEYGIGAIVDGTAPQLVLDEQAARASGADTAYIEREVARQLAEIERRRSAYQIGEPVALAGRNLILVDDGIATGGTVRVALKALASAGARSVTLAVPVAPASVFSELRKMCDRIVVLAVPEPFFAVGAHYRDFSQTGDAEVRALLESARSGVP
ncbi:phosphoribosyltransferase [Sphingopyxis terrae]|uniref:Predicted phosphoribosyltransferase n=1 Tax=Sphingopyxis terrae subsp. ummariensis TaxID=429001 RepID=A0A1Y6FRH0_9SPHN|nr:phosphoribosyltransferase family protein [Sphingopyxis terrae]PCF90607.1 phosphoribosyltransferase [Sphingopyxis terrae subsp. ummariensis]SMQ77399.1 Predicted phosphoribosyltransferase [Sphingopyxis terrae subsp. ummariensis]